VYGLTIWRISHVLWCDFYPTSCVFSIPEPWRGDRNHTTGWIKIISHHKTCMIDSFHYILYHQHTSFVCFVLWTSWRRNTECDTKKLSHDWYHIDIKEKMWYIQMIKKDIKYSKSKSFCLYILFTRMRIKLYFALKKHTPGNYLTILKFWVQDENEWLEVTMHGLNFYFLPHNSVADPGFWKEGPACESKV
jgi:hypothetical protein